MWPYSLTKERLVDILEDYTNWYDNDWHDLRMEGSHLSSDPVDVYVKDREKDPCWPDRPVSEPRSYY